MIRLNTSVIALVLLVTSVLFLPLASANQPAPRHMPPRQETPTPEPPVPTPNPTLTAIPFTETFDLSSGWDADGAWVHDLVAGYEGGGWRVDGMRRETVSTLQYQKYIDLSGSLSAQLMFRQKGSLPASDLVTFDISLDGGESWISVDSQVGVQTFRLVDESEQTDAAEDASDAAESSDAAAPPDAETPELAALTDAEDDGGWMLHRVDLGDFRGQVVTVRFRVLTGLPLPEMDEAFYQIDNIAIQYAFDVPEVVYTPYERGPRTLLGLHLIVGARGDPVYDLVRRMRDIGWPLGSVKGTTGTEDILAEVAKISPETVLVYRSLMTDRGMIDCPNQFAEPVAEAQAWMNGLWSYWAGVEADYFEIMNECLPPVEWLVPFTIEAMRLASERNTCLLVLSFAGGGPEPEVYARLAPVYQYALEHPCQPGRLHGIALHAYSGDPYRLLSESGIWLGLRHRLYYERILADVPDAIHVPLYMTEAGPGDGRTPFTCEDIARDVIQYTQQIEADPYIKGFHLWNVGPHESVWVDVSECLPYLGEALAAYYSGRPPP